MSKSITSIEKSIPSAASTCQHTMNLFVSSPVSDLQVEYHEPVNGSDKSVKFQNDVFLLFNQERLDRMSLDRFSCYLNDIQSDLPSLGSLRSKVSDSDLQNFVKSRYIQSKSELLAWSSYLTAQADILGSEISASLKKDSSADDVTQTDVTPSPAE